MIGRRPPTLIAHAGGTVDGRTGTNALEALHASYADGHRWFELDFCWTTDGHLVAIHDWAEAPATLFDREPGALTLAQFRGLAMKHGLTQLAFPDVLDWLDRHDDAIVITDVKGPDNLRALEVIAASCADRFVPQIYAPDEYEDVQRLGFGDVILALYRSSLRDDAIVSFARRHRMLAVTMPKERAASSGLPGRLDAAGVPLYAHTVNDEAEWDRLRGAGVAGVYTDLLSAGDAGR